MKKLFVVMGKACTGKDTIVKKLSDNLNIPIALSFTTRPKRKGETEGIEYNFITDEEFDTLWGHNRLAEFTSYDVAGGERWFYGLTKEELEKSNYVIVIVNPCGLLQLKELYGDKIVSILVDAEGEIRIQRYLNRDKMDDTKVAECCRRYLADEKDFKDVKSDYVIFNNTSLESAYKGVETILRREMANDISKSIDKDFRYSPMVFLKHD